jgi:hypothetical protein
MAGITVKDFEQPDELGRMTLQPGWRWSECIKPVVGGESCQVHHIGYCESGTLHVEHTDGTSVDLGEGDAYEIKPGHEAWVVGDAPFIGFELDQSAGRVGAARRPTAGCRCTPPRCRKPEAIRFKLNVCALDKSKAPLVSGAFVLRSARPGEPRLQRTVDRGPIGAEPWDPQGNSRHGLLVLADRPEKTGPSVPVQQ